MQRALLVLGLMISLAATGCANRRACNECNGPLGCRPCQIGWQRGGHDYGRHLSYSNTGQAPEGAAGPAAAQVAYPYYTTRGPRDFLLNNPPTIGR